MRTTLSIDDDVLAAARSLARQRGSSVGRVLSDLAREALSPPPPPDASGRRFPTFAVAPGGRPVTSELVADVLDEE